MSGSIFFSQPPHASQCSASKYLQEVKGDIFDKNGPAKFKKSKTFFDSHDFHNPAELLING